jgi:hypothetical protein
MHFHAGENNSPTTNPSQLPVFAQRDDMAEKILTEN